VLAHQQPQLHGLKANTIAKHHGLFAVAGAERARCGRFAILDVAAGFGFSEGI
jgi:hypothetical protein